MIKEKPEMKKNIEIERCHRAFKNKTIAQEKFFAE